MKNFIYYAPAKIFFGEGQITAIKDEISRNKRILFTYGGGSIKKNGVYDQVKEALKGHVVFEFSGIEPNPTYETCMQAVELVKKEKVDFLLAVGGGSVLDATKFIAAAACFNQKDAWDILKEKAEVKDAIPLGCVLTLPATGSETNPVSVITRAQTKDKLYFLSPCIIPKFAILDPTATFSLPEKQTVNGIVDSFVHVLEQYLTYPQEAKVQDRLAEGLLLTLIEEAPKVLSNPKNYDARANILWAATWALNTFLMCGVVEDWATHMIGHEITALYGIDHAATLAVVYPILIEFKKDKKHDKLLQYAERVWSIRDGNDEEKINLAIQKTKGFFKSLGVKTRLSDYGLNNSNIPPILKKLEEHGMTALGEHGDIDLKQAKTILQYCL